MLETYRQRVRCWRTVRLAVALFLLGAEACGLRQVTLIGIAAAQGADAPGSSQAKGAVELRQAFQNLMTPRQSFDTTPVEFSIAGARYRIPRNYLLTMNNWAGGPQEIVTLLVSLPDLKPRTPDNLACFERDPARRTLPCQPLEFHLSGPPIVTAEQALANWTDYSGMERPFPAPNGFEVFHTGKGASYVEHFVKIPGRDGEISFIQCGIGNTEGRYGQCATASDRVRSRIDIHLMFPFRDFEIVTAAEPFLKALIDSSSISNRKDTG